MSEPRECTCPWNNGYLRVLDHHVDCPSLRRRHFPGDGCPIVGRVQAGHNDPVPPDAPGWESVAALQTAYTEADRERTNLALLLRDAARERDEARAHLDRALNVVTVLEAQLGQMDAANSSLQARLDELFAEHDKTWTDYSRALKVVEAARLAEKRLRAVLIVVAPHLDKPYSDAPETSSWQQSVHPAMVRLREALAVDAYNTNPEEAK